MKTNTQNIKPNYKYMVSKSIELLRIYNPTTHSIDTLCDEHLGNVRKPDSNPDNLFIQQVVYGSFKEKNFLDSFIADLYAENAAKVLRADMILYKVFAYLAIFRLDEMGFARFKEIANSQEPSKASAFCNYIFSKDNLRNTLLASWMKVRDLDYVEKEIIAPLEKYIPDAMQYLVELEGVAASNAAAEAAKKEAEAKGEVGLKKVAKKAGTRPISPKLTRPKLPSIPEPERIGQEVKANPVPTWLNNTNVKLLEKNKIANRNKVREDTLSKYDDKLLFKLHDAKHGRPIDEVRQEIEDKYTAQLQFENSYYKPPPNFSKIKAPVRLNASVIYREDALYRKQQAKDAQTLLKYEEELRDPTEYYIWKADMEKKDHDDKLKQVALRREQARLSSVEAKNAMDNQKKDNQTVGSMLRDQAELIKERKSMLNDIEQLKKQEIVDSVVSRRHRPGEEVAKVLAEKKEVGETLREELERKRAAKLAEDKIADEIQTDKIRQQKALNTVHKEHITVFDPTKSSGIGLLDEMSYMEMKERLKLNQQKEKEDETYKRYDIIEAKQKRAADLERRANSMVHARKVKAEANKIYYQNKREERQLEAEKAEKLREEAALELQRELEARRELSRREKEKLIAEQERIKKKQQFLGASVNQLEETREKEIMKAKEREAKTVQKKIRQAAVKNEDAGAKDRKNKEKAQKVINKEKEAIMAEKESLYQYEKKIAVGKIKDNVMLKKEMFKTGQLQFEKTRTVKIEHNPYANKISEDSLTRIGSKRFTQQLQH